MSEIGKILTSPEYWFVAVFTGLVVSVVANVVTRCLPTVLFGDWVRYALVANALLLPFLVTTPYSTSAGADRIQDFFTGVILASGYIFAAYLPSRRLRAFALFGPNLTMLVLAASAYWRGVDELWLGVLAAYPLVFLLFVNPVIIWALVVFRRTQHQTNIPIA